MLDRPGGRKTSSRSQIFLLGALGHPTQGACPYPNQGWDGEQSGQPGLAGDRSPCPSLSGCVFCKTTFLLGLTRDPPHPPSGGWELSQPAVAKKADTQSLRLFLQKAQTKAWLLLRPAPGAQPGAQGSQGPHLPAPHPLACLSVLLAWPKGASDSGAGPGVAVVSGLHRQVTESPTRNSR